MFAPFTALELHLRRACACRPRESDLEMSRGDPCLSGLSLVWDLSPDQWEQYKEILASEGWIDPSIPTDYDVHRSMSNGRSLVAIDMEGRVLCGILYSVDEASKSVFLSTYMTHKTQRGRGIGSLLSRSFLAQLNNFGYSVSLASSSLHFLPTSSPLLTPISLPHFQSAT